MRDLCSSAAALQDLETEFSQLQEDREILRKIIPSGNSKVRIQLNLLHWLMETLTLDVNLHNYGALTLVTLLILWRFFLICCSHDIVFFSQVALPVNLGRLIWNAQKTFHLTNRTPSDLHPLRVTEGMRLELKIGRFCFAFCWVTYWSQNVERPKQQKMTEDGKVYLFIEEWQYSEHMLFGKLLSIKWRLSMGDMGNGTVKKHVKVFCCLPCKPL